MKFQLLSILAGLAIANFGYALGVTGDYDRAVLSTAMQAVALFCVSIIGLIESVVNGRPLK